jgi:hypothetical protein
MLLLLMMMMVEHGVVLLQQSLVPAMLKQRAATHPTSSYTRRLQPLTLTLLVTRCRVFESQRRVKGNGCCSDRR